MARRYPLLAFATHISRPDGTQDDHILADILPGPVDFVPWSDPDYDWRAADAVVIRSTWDYHLRLPEFLTWIDGLAKARVRVLNAPALVRWNARKTYLRDLERRGVTVVPTRWINAADIDQLHATHASTGWERAVIKPVVAATSYLTHVITADNARVMGTELAQPNVPDGFLLQPFLNEVVDPGEWSLMFFGGAFSHGVLKTPVAGDFRVQDDFGGTSRPGSPGDDVVQQASAILDTLPEMPLYARVDGVVSDGHFVLIELELIEPVLFFGHETAAAPRLARAIQEHLVR